MLSDDLHIYVETSLILEMLLQYSMQKLESGSFYCGDEGTSPASSRTEVPEFIYLLFNKSHSIVSYSNTECVCPYVYKRQSFYCGDEGTSPASSRTEVPEFIYLLFNKSHSIVSYSNT
ncbi:hypothetical protein A6R68_05703, partial [Neotoma lepida]